MTGGRTAVLIAGGFSVWAVAFVVLYGALSVGCALNWHERTLVAGLTLQQAQLFGLFGLHLAAGAGVLAWAWRLPAPEGATAAFTLAVGRWASLAAVGATVFTFLGLFLLPTCT
ncbi:hypothetical protein [Zavarzinia sp. CC-PAN008]|uniref:hypothetical protein n=1 Tax=Zavarzinia sp. CC-PAN008 TaxID=3243332 RepID=UPI003F74A8A6